MLYFLSSFELRSDDENIDSNHRRFCSNDVIMNDDAFGSHF